MLLAHLVDVSAQVASTRSRLAKRELIADLLREVAGAGGEEIDVAASYLSGTLRQRRTGLGWRSLAELPHPADEPTVGLVEVDETLEEISALSGSGSMGARRDAVTTLFGRLTEAEQVFLRNLVTGNVRQGALDSVMLDAIAAAAELDLKVVRRAAMFSAPTGPIARAALTGGAEALEDFSLLVGRPVRPMLAGTAPDVAAGVEKVEAPFAVDTKLDGIRIQVHKHGDEVAVFTRSLDEIGARLPEVVEATRALPATDLILDGEALTLDETGRPRPFQETASTTATHSGATGIRPFFFDLLLHEGDSLIESSTRDRLARLDEVVPEDAARAPSGHRVGRRGAGVLRPGRRRRAGRGHPQAPRRAVRRRPAWLRMGQGQAAAHPRPGGARRRVGQWPTPGLAVQHPPRRARAARTVMMRRAEFVMLGKTFKGMTDEMLTWQTERFLALETGREGHVVHVRPEQVVEIAFDGVQRSTRYPGGVALRFARVLRYRDDKTPAETDTLGSVRALLSSG